VPVITRPRGLLFDYGGTLVEEVGFDTRAGNEMLLTRAANPSGELDLNWIIERADRVSREVADRRDHFQIEVPWASLTRLIHDFAGTRFDVPLSDLELVFWNAAAKTRPMPGARDALESVHRSGIPMGVVSNSAFGKNVIRHELSKHGLADFLDVIVVSAEYGVRKPNPLLFETAAALLGVPCGATWFVGDRLDTDVAGARAAGMTAVWYASQNHPGGTNADLVVSSWPGLVALLRDAGA